MSTTLGDNLKYCRVRKGMTQAELAKFCKVSDYKTVQKWEYGHSAPRSATLAKLCELFGETMQDMYSNRIREIDAKRAAQPKNIEPLPSLHQVPVQRDADQTAGWLALAPTQDATFAVRAEGDSMRDAGIRHDAIVYVHEQNDVESGQVAAIRFEGSKFIALRRLYKLGGKILLHPECSGSWEAEDIVYDESEAAEKFTILGRAVSCTNIIV